ncbi:MAG: hypothetical protein ACI9WU_004374 [Myxococcota bacterium]|jgi:hypothetical protein
MNTHGRWQVGPLTLWLRHEPGDWWLGRLEGPDPLASGATVTLPEPEPAPPDVYVMRFAALPDAEGEVELLPVLADRPVVVRPEPSVELPAGGQVVLYVSTPVWVRVRVGGVVVHDVPTLRPSDTWFGSDTMSGELCYASRTAARVQLDRTIPRAARATTSITVRNRGTRPMTVRRISLPAPTMTLFAEASGRLWTDPLYLESEDGLTVHVRRHGSPPPEAPEATLVAQPHKTLEPGLAILRRLTELVG